MSRNLPSPLHSGPTVPRWINRLVTGLLRSPFHARLRHTTMLLTFTGRKSGRRYTIPVRYQGLSVRRFSLSLIAPGSATCAVGHRLTFTE